MAWKYSKVLYILLSLYALRLLWLHMTTSFEIDSESDHWDRSRVGSPKIINRYGGATATKRKGQSSRLREKSEIKLPPSCQKYGICDHAPDYPEDLVKSLLDDFINQNGPKVFKNDVLLTQNTSLSDKMHGDINTDDIVMCKTKEKLFIPKLAYKNTTWNPIVNLDWPKQSFRAVICDEENAQACNGFLSHQNYLSGECKQQYVLRNMVAVDTKNKRLIIEPFPVPSCCSCFVKLNNEK